MQVLRISAASVGLVYGSVKLGYLKVGPIVLVLVTSAHSICALICVLANFRQRQRVPPRSNKQVVVTIDGRYRHNMVPASASECQASLHEGNFCSSGFCNSNEIPISVPINTFDAVAADDLMIEQKDVSNSSVHSHVLESQSCWRSLPSDVASSGVPVLTASSTATSQNNQPDYTVAYGK